MIKLFNEEVNITSTNSVHNTLYVESFEEVFFGVYEFELNSITVIAEEVAKYRGNPVVTIPVVDGSNKYNAPFILRKGAHRVKFNAVNTVFVDKVIKKLDLNTLKSTYNTLYVESFEEIFFGIYEFELNGDTVIAEKVATYKGDPVVTIPVITDGNKYEAPFILKEGVQKVKFNTANTVFIEKVIEESDLNVDLDLTAQRQVVKLFNEEVDITSTNSVHNTLYVESFKEVFSGVYEFELNGDTVIAEKIASYESAPVIAIPVVAGGNKYEAPFILRKGKPKIEFNELNTVFIEKVIEESDLNTDINTVFGEQGTEELDRNVVNTVFVDNVITELDLNTDLQMVKLFTEDVPTTLTNSVHNTLYVESFEEVFFGVYEFKLNGVNVVAEEVAKYEGDPVVAIPIVVDGNKYEAPFILKEGVQKVKFNVVNTVFIDQVTEEPEINTAIEAVKQNICDNNISTNAYDVDKSGIVKDINKALSRVGSVKKELEDSKRDIAKTIMLAEERIRKHYDVKMREIEKASVNTIRKSQILEAVKDSKVRILAELNNSQGLKKQLRDIAEEASNGLYDPVSSKRFQDQIKKDLTHSFSTEMQQIKRMVSSYGGGGGSNAVQYARGGTMHGNLNIEGNILSGGVDLATLFDSDTVGEVTGTGTAGNLTIWDSVSSVANSVISESAGVVSINGPLDSVFSLTLSSAVGTTVLSASPTGLYTSTGIDVNGDTTISGNLSVLGDFTYIDTIVSITSALSVTNHGTGPAIYAEQTGVGQPIAKFVDTEGGVIVFDDGGKLGIGTEVPAQSLDVIGKIAVCGVTAVYIPHLSANYTGSSFYGDGGTLLNGYLPYQSVNNTGVGVGALFNVGQGWNNTAVGSEALASSTEGTDNAATGYAALSANTTGCFNTANGSFALGKNTTGSRNTATGFAALSTNIYGRDNIAFGAKSLTNNIYGCFNAAIGNCALFLNNTGCYNTAIGQQAMYFNTSGENNIAVGSHALWINTTGDYNTAVGKSALNQNSTGLLNTATGAGALNCTTGSYNTADGAFALGENAAGFSNVGTGYQAGRYIADGTTANATTIRSTFIGSNTKASASGVTNETVIGYDAIGSGTNTVTIGNSLVTKTVLQGKVGIGTGDPDEALTVSGNISASGTVRGTNIDTLTNNVSAIYSYLIQNFETNTITIAASISDFVSNYPKTGLVTGDVLTISATNTSYILGDNDGSALSDWLEVNLKPNFLFYKQGLADYGVLDTIALSSVRSTKYIVEVSDKSDDAIFYGEVNVVSDGTIAVATEYGLNHTTLFPFVEFGAEVLNGTHIQLSAIALEGKNMSNFVFKGNRSNLFG